MKSCVVVVRRSSSSEARALRWGVLCFCKLSIIRKQGVDCRAGNSVAPHGCGRIPVFLQQLLLKKRQLLLILKVELHHFMHTLTMCSFFRS